MKPMDHQIAISHVDRIASTEFTEFMNSITSEKLDVSVEPRKSSGPYASMAWYIATAVFVWIGKSYFESFLKEMGREHYQVLKGALGKLQKKFLSSSAEQVKLISAEGELLEENKYSLNYSILAEANSEFRFKLLFRHGITEEDYQQALDGFFTFLSSYHEKALKTEMVEKLAKCPVIGSTILLEFSPESKTIEAVNPLPDGVRLPEQ